MASDKIIITEKLRMDIIESRKNKGLSSYELSERSGNGHSKFWLQNIESGKTKKITKQDLVSLYMAINEDEDEEDVTNEIEKILNQPVGNTSKQWYELIKISDDFSEMYDENELMNKLDELLEENIVDDIRCEVFGMSTNQKQAALTAVQNFQRSLYKNPELVFALMNIPLYGVDESNEKEHDDALNDLLAISAKYNDLVIKNNSIKVIEAWHDRDEYWERLSREAIQNALVNFKNILQEIIDASKMDNPDLFELAYKFNTDVTFLIERGQPNATKNYLKSFRIHDGKGFAKHIKECYDWFRGFDSRYGITDLYSVITKKQIQPVYEYLNSVGEIKHVIKVPVKK